MQNLMTEGGRGKMKSKEALYGCINIFDVYPNMPSNDHVQIDLLVTVGHYVYHKSKLQWYM